MAVVFISPKQRQKVFFLGITVIFLLFLVFISLVVFFSKPKQASTVLVFNKAKVSIDMAIFDLDQFKNLQPFTEMQTQFVYNAVTKDKKPVTGFITAASINDAQKVLESMGMTSIDLKEAEIGRDNPFEPYYQPVASPVSITTKTTSITKKAVTKTTTSK